MNIILFDTSTHNWPGHSSYKVSVPWPVKSEYTTNPTEGVNFKYLLNRSAHSVFPLSHFHNPSELEPQIGLSTKKHHEVKEGSHRPFYTFFFFICKDLAWSTEARKISWLQFFPEVMSQVVRKNAEVSRDRFPHKCNDEMKTVVSDILFYHEKKIFFKVFHPVL